MTITSTLSNALSGLVATSRAAELVSSNVANSMTDGYGPRELQISGRIYVAGGAGVRVDGISRNVDEALLGDRRLADASVGYHQTLNEFSSGMVQAIGSPDNAGSLSALYADFEAALVHAATRPDNDARLTSVVDAAKNLVNRLNGLSDHIQAARQTADGEISKQVGLMNDNLEAIKDLNIKIQDAHIRGMDPSALMDLRQSKIDEIAPIVPLRQLPRENGAVALISNGGAILLDGGASYLSFSATNTIVPEMRVESGAISMLALNDQPQDMGRERGVFAGGSLAALFQVRDQSTVAAHDRLDGLARDIIERFQDSAVDPSLPLGAAGLFTDGGAVFVATNEMALASRLAINGAVDTSQGGEVWKLRDGLGASAPSNVGNNSILNQMIEAVRAPQTPASAALPAVDRSASGRAADLLSLFGGENRNSESRLGFALGQHQTLRQMELAKGVDTDAEMQKLMVLEQAYAANARVISAADEMIQTILAL